MSTETELSFSEALLALKERKICRHGRWCIGLDKQGAFYSIEGCRYLDYAFLYSSYFNTGWVIADCVGPAQCVNECITGRSRND